MGTITLHKYGSGDKLILNVMNVGSFHTHEGITIVHCIDEIYRVQESLEIVKRDCNRALDELLEERLKRFERERARYIDYIIAKYRMNMFTKSTLIEKYQSILADYTVNQLRAKDYYSSFYDTFGLVPVPKIKPGVMDYDNRKDRETKDDEDKK